MNWVSYCGRHIWFTRGFPFHRPSRLDFRKARRKLARHESNPPNLPRAWPAQDQIFNSVRYGETVGRRLIVQRHTPDEDASLTQPTLRVIAAAAEFGDGRSKPICFSGAVMSRITFFCYIRKLQFKADSHSPRNPKQKLSLQFFEPRF